MLTLDLPGNIRRQNTRILSSMRWDEVVSLLASRYKEKEIRRKPLPAGFCYVCSRIDPDGKFKHPHGYLFSKGFFAQCEHMPKTPYPTVIIDSKAPSPSISEPIQPMRGLRVKITRRSKSPPSKYGKKYFDKSALDGVRYDDDFYENSRYSVPSMFDHVEDEGGKKIPEVGKLSWMESESGSDPDHEDIIVNYIEDWNDEDAALMENQSEYGNQQTTPTEREVLLPPIGGQKSKSGTSKSSEFTLPEPKFSEKLPLIHGSVDRINASRERLEKKPSKRKSRKSSDTSPKLDDADMIYTGKDDEYGHIKYHHRGMYDSVPSGGLELPPSRETHSSRHTTSKSLTADNHSTLDQEMDKKSRSRLSSGEISFGIPETPSMIIARISNSDHWCQCEDVDMSTIKCPECHIVGGHEKWCIHSRSSAKQGNCPKCGKPIKRNNIRGSSYKHQKSRRDSKSTSKSEEFDISAGKNRDFMDDYENKRVRFDDEHDFDQKKRLDMIRQNDEDYMAGVDDILYDQENYGRLWTPNSQDEEDRKRKKINPNIHREAYLRALLDVKNNQLKKIAEVDENFFASRLCRPHVFSYFRLRPQQAKHNAMSEPVNIGLKPDESKGIPPRKGMKHIFGKVKVDDFYPGGKKNPSFNISMKKEDKRQTMPIHSINYSK
ncbi:uncharacterized protein LOC125647728 isoform X2 [Ostrea edulis]|uniref:uncharacterized protein LOC125647728 isoform X2 n=1 Tax=Ostrea edulis TaxID=37623 RepID=UPI0020956276|nr:uncharacterized protein LOC125647728 isoform X2 [Ostrea edulis]